MKIVTVVGTRPEIIRLSRIINALDSSLQHYLIHTGQNYDYELNDIFFDDLDLKKPKYYLDAVGDNPADTIAKIISSFNSVLDKIRPDAVLVLGDTNSCLAVIAAKRRKIPIFHLEAGNRCFDERVPEEINRKIVDHISDINITYSDISREYLLKEGFPSNRIIKLGSPLYEVLEHYSAKINESKILDKLKLTKDKFFLVSCHREENIDYDHNISSLHQVLNEVSIRYQLPIIFSTHPRTRNKIEKMNLSFNPLVKILKPLSFTDYNYLQKNALVVLSDSGSISEEASILGIKALNIRETHERPEAMEEATVIMTGIDTKNILDCIELLINSNFKSQIVRDYSFPNVSEKVLKIILSYTGYVNREVWKKS